MCLWRIVLRASEYIGSSHDAKGAAARMNGLAQKLVVVGDDLLRRRWGIRFPSTVTIDHRASRLRCSLG